MIIPVSRILLLAACLPAVALAGVTFSDAEGMRSVTVGGWLQLQYHKSTHSAGVAADRVFFRRLCPFVEGVAHEDWLGRIEADFGDSRVDLNDAYVAWTGKENFRLILGNAMFPFSQEAVTPYARHQLPERTLVGDRGYGVPQYQPGLHLRGASASGRFQWGAAMAMAATDPDTAKIAFVSPVSPTRQDERVTLNPGMAGQSLVSDWSEGWLMGGRLSFYPKGSFEPGQGDFDRTMRYCFSFGGYTWANDKDNVRAGGWGGTRRDLDKVTGVEVSGALRWKGVSVDAEYNSYGADLLDRGVTSNAFVDSTTTLDNWCLEGGYMLIPSRLELVAAYESQEADGYLKKWTRATYGVNLFARKHDIKAQVAFRQAGNEDGARWRDHDEVVVQAQYGF